MGWIEAVFCCQPPVAGSKSHADAHDRVMMQDFFRHIILQRRRLAIADERSDDSLTFLQRIGFNTGLADYRRVRPVCQCRNTEAV